MFDALDSEEVIRIDLISPLTVPLHSLIEPESSTDGAVHTSISRPSSLSESFAVFQFAFVIALLILDGKDDASCSIMKLSQLTRLLTCFKLPSQTQCVQVDFELYGVFTQALVVRWIMEYSGKALLLFSIVSRCSVELLHQLQYLISTSVI